MNLGTAFGLLTKLPMVLGIVGAIVAGIEHLGAAIAATGPEKREAAIGKAREALQSLGLTLSHDVLGALVDVTVWVMNMFGRKAWSEGIAEDVTETKREVAAAAPTKADADARLDQLEADARAELAALSTKTP